MIHGKKKKKNEMSSIRPLQVLSFINRFSLNGQSRIRRLYICLYISESMHYITILGMLAKLIRDIVCEIIHCSLVQCEVGSIPVYSCFDRGCLAKA